MQDEKTKDVKRLAQEKEELRKQLKASNEVNAKLYAKALSA